MCGGSCTSCQTIRADPCFGSSLKMLSLSLALVCRPWHHCGAPSSTLAKAKASGPLASLTRNPTMTLKAAIGSEATQTQVRPIDWWDWGLQLISKRMRLLSKIGRRKALRFTRLLRPLITEDSQVMEEKNSRVQTFSSQQHFTKSMSYKERGKALQSRRRREYRAHSWNVVPRV